VRFQALSPQGLVLTSWKLRRMRRWRRFMKSSNSPDCIQNFFLSCREDLSTSTLDSMVASTWAHIYIKIKQLSSPPGSPSPPIQRTTTPWFWWTWSPKTSTGWLSTSQEAKSTREMSLQSFSRHLLSLVRERTTMLRWR